MKLRKSLLGAAMLLMAASINLVPAQARGGGPNVQAIVQSNFATAQSRLRSQISGEVANGQLDPGTAGGLTAQLDQIAGQTQADLARGAMNNDEMNRLNNMFTDITNQVNAAGSRPAYTQQYQPFSAPGLDPYANPYANQYANPYANPYGGYNPYAVPSGGGAYYQF